MKKQTKKIIALALAAVLVFSLMLTACGGGEPSAPGKAQSGTQQAESLPAEAKEGTASVQSDSGVLPAPEIPGLSLESTMEKEYATQYDVFYYTDGYKVLSISDGRQYLLVPEGKEVPEGAPESLIALYAPLDHTYLAATCAMALIVAIGAIDNITMTGTDASGWYVEEAKKAIQDGKIIYAGKYSEPDYELLVDKECNLALESTMILHTPKVQEMIEKMDIPVFIDRSSYETGPLGRSEWIKLYGAMFDKENEAEAVYAQKSQIVKDMKDFANTEKTVAFFYVKTDGTVSVRNPSDYVSTMIDLGGARYAFRDMKVPTDAGSSINISMEEFYATAVDVDYLVYNATISKPISTIDELLQKSELFADCKAVKDGNVWCCSGSMYQKTDIAADFILDINHMITDGSEDNMVFLTKVN